MGVTQEIEAKLQATFAPSQLEVVDDSESHRGHAGYREGGESHFNVRMVSEHLKGLSRIQRHRAVHQALGQDLIERIHALALDLSTE